MRLEEVQRIVRTQKCCVLCGGALEDIEYVDSASYGHTFNGQVSCWDGKRKFYDLKRCTVCGLVYAKVGE